VFIARAQPAINLNQGSIEQPHYFQVIPYEKVSGKLLVPVTIQGKKYRFLLDTGAPFALTAQLFRDLKPALIGSAPVEDAAGKEDSMQFILLPRLNLQEVTFLNTPGVVIQDSASAVLKCLGIDGIIGSNMLRNSAVQFDDRQRVITLTDDAHRLSLENTRYQPMELSAPQSGPYFQVYLKKGGQIVSDKVLFDSGTDGFYEMSADAYQFFSSKIEVADKIAEGGRTFNWALHGKNEEPQFVLSIPDFSIGGMELQRLIVTTSGHGASLVGTALLQYAKITLDYKDKLFFLVPHAQNDLQQLSKRPWAIELNWQNGKAVVGSVWDKARAAQVQVGDEILQFGSLDLRSVSACDMFLLRRPNEGEAIPVTLKDAGTGQVKQATVKRL
jgi:hypothetical protein